MAHYYVGDEPTDTLVIQPASLLDPAAVTGATAELVSPSGAVTAQDADVLTEDGETDIAVQLGTLLDSAGMWHLHVTVDVPAGRLQLMPIPIPVGPIDSPWYTIDQARGEWPSAPDNDAHLYALLDAARVHVLAYAPERDDVPVNYRAAQLMQARNIWNADHTDPAASYGGPDSFSVTVFPLDWAVKQMLRPRRGKPIVA